MRKKWLLSSFVLAILINLLLVFPFPSLAAVGELEEGMSWSYVVKLNDEPFMLNKVNVLNREKVGNENIWSIKEDYTFKILDSKYVDEYQGETVIKLHDDFTLYSLANIQKKNGQKDSYESIKRIKGGYAYFKNNSVKTIEKEINTEHPLYLYSYKKPWLVELLIENNIVVPGKTCSAISSSGQAISIECLNNPAEVNEKGEYLCCLADDDQIYLNKHNGSVVKIESMDDGIFEVIPADGISVEELIAFDGKTIAYPVSNIPLLERELLTSMTVFIDIAQGFANCEYLQNSSERQSFKGTVDEDRIKGEVTVNRACASGERTEPKNPFAFPVTIEWGPEFAGYLCSHPLLEVEAPEIIAKAKEITKGATNTWEAAVAIARWVRESTEYNYAFDKLSALGTLKEGKGVCGQFALLTTALCRAVNIPARFITGFTYMPDEIAFVPHAWVEIFTGETGWRPMDPTSGQFNSLGVTHIGICDTINLEYILNSFKPGTIKILNYTPEDVGRPIAPSLLNASKLRIYKKRLHYEISAQREKIGEYTAHLKGTVNGGCCLLESVVLPDFEGQAKLLMNNQGYTLKYTFNGFWDGMRLEREFLFEESLMIKFVHGDRKNEKEITRIFPDDVQVDLYAFVQWGLLAARLVEDVEGETTKTVTVFTADTPGYRNLEAIIRPCIVEFGEYMDVGWFLEISGAQYKKELYMTKEGVLTRMELPEMLISAVLIQ